MKKLALVIGIHTFGRMPKVTREAFSDGAGRVFSWLVRLSWRRSWDWINDIAEGSGIRFTIALVGLEGIFAFFV